MPPSDSHRSIALCANSAYDAEGAGEAAGFEGHVVSVRAGPNRALVGASGGRCVVAFRGTDNLENVVQDARVSLRSLAGGGAYKHIAGPMLVMMLAGWGLYGLNLLVNLARAKLSGLPGLSFLALSEELDVPEEKRDVLQQTLDAAVSYGFVQVDESGGYTLASGGGGGPSEAAPGPVKKKRPKPRPKPRKSEKKRAPKKKGGRKSSPAAPRVHVGFYDALHMLVNAGLDKVVEETMSRLSTSEVVLTGHSLGGAMATHYAYDLCRRRSAPGRAAVELVTFGEPHTGDEAFARAMRGCGIRATRYAMYNDPIPIALNAVPGFVHPFPAEMLGVSVLSLAAQAYQTGGDVGVLLSTVHRMASYLEYFPDKQTSLAGGGGGGDLRALRRRILAGESASGMRDVAARRRFNAMLADRR